MAAPSTAQKAAASGAPQPAGRSPQAPPAPPARAPSVPPPPPLDLSPSLRRLSHGFAVGLGSLAAVLSLLVGAPLHVASGRGFAAWFLVLALGALVRRSAASSARPSRVDTKRRP